MMYSLTVEQQRDLVEVDTYASEESEEDGIVSSWSCNLGVDAHRFGTQGR